MFDRPRASAVVSPKENYGDIAGRLLLRDKLKCQSFNWYLKNIYPDLHIPEDRAGWHGAVSVRRAPGSRRSAAHTFISDTIISGDVFAFLVFSQSCLFVLKVRNLGINSECLDYNAPEHSVTGASLSLFGCHGQGGNQVRRLF